jgi:hypothetical protein
MITPDPDDLTEEQLKAALDKLRTEEGQQEFIDRMWRLHDLLSSQIVTIRADFERLAATPMPPTLTAPDWPRLRAALDEIQSLLETGQLDPLMEAVDRFEDFVLYYKGETAAARASIEGVTVRVVDEVAHRFEQVRFELPSESRDEIEDVLQPYHDGMRERLLGNLPIEERRAIEEEDRRRREGE